MIEKIMNAITITLVTEYKSSPLSGQVLTVVKMLDEPNCLTIYTLEDDGEHFIRYDEIDYDNESYIFNNKDIITYITIIK